MKVFSFWTVISLTISIFLNTQNSDGTFLGVGVGYPNTFWVVSWFSRWFLGWFLGGFVVTTNNKVKVQIRLLQEKNNSIAKTSAELSGGNKVSLQSKCLLLNLANYEISTYLSNTTALSFFYKNQQNWTLFLKFSLFLGYIVLNLFLFFPNFFLNCP